MTVIRLRFLNSIESRLCSVCFNFFFYFCSVVSQLCDVYRREFAFDDNRSASEINITVKV